MSNIHITCPACRSTLEIDAESEGQEVQCGACMETFVAKASPSRSSAGSKVPAEADERKSAKRKPRRRRRDDDDDDDDYDYDDDDYRRPRRSRSRRYYTGERKSRVAYILLGVFLGHWGVHNFYAGRTSPGLAQLLITVLSFPLMFLFCIGVVTIWIPYIWAIIDIITVDRDGNNVPMLS